MAAAEPLGVPVFAALPYGVSPYFLGYPGTVALRLDTYLRVATDILDSLAGAGFRRILLVNGHGGNIATIAAAFAEVYAGRSLSGPDSRVPPLTLRQRNWWELPGVMAVDRKSVV